MRISDWSSDVCSSKQILIEALFADLLEQLDAQLDAQLEGELEGDARSSGRFTRAYVRAMTRLSEEASNGVWNALTLAIPDLECAFGDADGTGAGGKPEIVGYDQNLVAAPG